jgi:hypothetical protein
MSGVGSEPEVAGQHTRSALRLNPDVLMGWLFALPRWNTLGYAENVGSQFHSLRQRTRCALFSVWARTSKNPNRSMLVQLGLWTATSLPPSRMFSDGRIFSEPLDSTKLVQSFGPRSHKVFFPWSGAEVRIALA